MGEAQALVNELQKLQNSGECWMKTAVDAELRLDRVFFAFSGSLESFKAYGQVLMVDATYRVNRFCMPLILFVGVGGDGHNTVFGYSLVKMETEFNVTWAFNCLKEYVGDDAWKQCTSIMTDGGTCFPNVIEETIPHAKHIRCIFHIIQDTEKALKNKIIDWSAFSNDWYDAVVRTKDEIEFETAWTDLKRRYMIAASEYLDGQYKYRHKFVRCFVKNYCTLNCWATQRSESENRVSGMCHIVSRWCHIITQCVILC